MIDACTTDYCWVEVFPVPKSSKQLVFKPSVKECEISQAASSGQHIPQLSRWSWKVIASHAKSPSFVFVMIKLSGWSWLPVQRIRQGRPEYTGKPLTIGW